MMTKLLEIARIVLIGLASLIFSPTISFAAPRSEAIPRVAASISAENAEAFVHRVYARYRKFDSPGVPTDRPGGTPFYSKALLDLFAKESALAHGEVGAIDADPLCACQAYENLRVTGVAVTVGKAGSVKAKVTFINLGSRQTVALTLIQTPAGWRIGDVGNKNMKSAMAVLQDAIAHPIQEPPSTK